MSQPHQPTHKSALLAPPPAAMETIVIWEGLCLGPLPLPPPQAESPVLGTFKVDPVVVVGDADEGNGEDGSGGAGAGDGEGGEGNA